MRYSWNRLAGFLLVLAAACVVSFVLWCGVLLLSVHSVANHDEYWVEGILARKMSAAAKRDGGRLIILAGSGGWYGFRTKALEEVLGVPVVNLAVHAGLSIEGVSLDALSIARPGDAILMAFEYQQFERDPFQYRMIGHILRNHPWLAFQVAPDEWLRCIMAPPLSEISYRRSLTERLRKGEDMYNFARTIISLTDDEGEITDRNAKYYHAIDPSTQQKTLGDINPAARAMILRYIAIFQGRGMPVFAVFSPRLLHPDYDREQVAGVQREIRKLYEGAGVVVVGEPRIDVAQTDQYFDNGTHLTEKGAIERSRHVAEKLLAAPAFQEWLANRPRGKQ